MAYAVIFTPAREKVNQDESKIRRSNSFFLAMRLQNIVVPAVIWQDATDSNDLG